MGLSLHGHRRAVAETLPQRSAHEWDSVASCDRDPSLDRHLCGGGDGGILDDPAPHSVEAASYPHTSDVRDTGILAAGSVARRIHRERFLLVGGAAALVMAVAASLG